MPASYPGSIWSPTTKNTNDVIQAAFFNDPQAEIVAIETQLLTTGTWTTTLVSSGGGTPTYTNATGFYLRKGSEVTISGILTLATLGTLASGNLTITGLPFTSKNVAGCYASVNVPYWLNFTSSLIHIGGYIAPNTATIVLTKTTAAATGTTTLTQADLAGTSEFIFTATYLI